MNKSFAPILVLATWSANVAAQPADPAKQQAGAAARPVQPAVAIDVFLEQRVAEELAADGLLLSRLGVALDLELVGDKLIISFVDPATRRAVASTKIDLIPADRDAAAAAVTQVAANLAAQLSAPALSGSAAVLNATLEQERRARDARTNAEYLYRQEEIRFSDTDVADGAFIAFKGDVRRRLVGRDLYEALGREDLADAYTERRTIGVVSSVGGGTALVLGTVVSLYGLGAGCDYGAEHDACVAEVRPYLYAGLAAAAVGTIALGVGVHYLVRPHPVSQREIYDLGEKHNAKLRQKHGLAVAPYASSDGGGLSVVGRF